MRKGINFLILFLYITSCTLLQKSDLADDTLLSIDGISTSADEFLYVYEKNNFNNDSIYTSNDVEEYFDLFVNFKLKVTAAKSNGIDTTETFINEFSTYKDQLIKPYLSETKEQERLVIEAYERIKYEIDASHILVAVEEDALPEDTIKAYKKILDVYKKAKEGQDFAELAFTYSEDPSAKSNKGNLGYFSAFQMVFSFEDAAYKTPIDSISDIIRSRFGYHIMKVHDKRSFSGKVKVSHIMLIIQSGQTDTIATRNKIFEIHDQLVGGADWDELCQRYPQDQRTKNSGGTLPFIGLRQINDDAFENVAFNLQEPGEISDPVRTKFGWHIIKLEEKMGLEPFEEIKDDLEQKVSKDGRSQLSRISVIKKLMVQNRFLEVGHVREQLIDLADSSLLVGKWNIDIPYNLIGDTVFTISDTPYLVNQVIDDIQKNQKRRTGLDAQSYMHELIDKYIEEQLIDFEEQQLIQSNRDFRMLLNEYYEGILLFDIMNQKVWGKAVADTTGLRTYFEANQEEYYWGKRVDAVIITSSNHDIIQDVQSIVDSESFLLYDIEFSLDEEIEIVNHQQLDSLFILFDKYEQSTLVISLAEDASQSDFYSDLKQHFTNMGVPDSSLVESLIDDTGNKIHLELNSRSKKSLEYLYNRESALTLQVDEGLFELGDNELIDTLRWEKGVYEIKSGDDSSIILINGVLSEEPKKLKDVKGLVISDYQNYLEKIWINELKNRYTVNINEITLDKIKKAYKKKLNSTG